MASPGLLKEISNEMLNSWAPSWHFTDRGGERKRFPDTKAGATAAATAEVFLGTSR